MKKILFDFAFLIFLYYLCSRLCAAVPFLGRATRKTEWPRWWNGRHEGLKIP